MYAHHDVVENMVEFRNKYRIVFIVYDLLMPRYTGLLTNCSALGAGKLAVF